MSAPGKPFQPDDPRTREAGRRGGQRTAASRRKNGVTPYPGTLFDVMNAVGMVGHTWEPWRSFWRVASGLPLNPQDRERFHRHTARTTIPASPFRVVFLITGRRGGKTRNQAVAAFHKAISFDARTLAPGESGIVLFLASDRAQAAVGLKYVKGIARLPCFQPWVHRVLKHSIELHSGISLVVGTADHAAVRGYSLIACIADELGFWSVNPEAASPDVEVLNAVRGGMLTVPGSLLLAASSPYAARGELYAAFERSFGSDTSRELVWVADTRSMNPRVPQEEIDGEFERDPASAASEFGRDGVVQFRRDIESFLDHAAILAVTAPDRRELPPVAATRYYGFCDPSGGSQDSFTLAIAHREGTDRAVLDCLRERRPPFNSDDVVAEYAELLRSYGVFAVVGDRYGGQWPPERFRQHGITYTPTERAKSDIYGAFLPAVNSQRVELLDLPALRAQLVGLERRVARGGKDSIDHPPGGRDDVANVVAGALVCALPQAATSGKRYFLGWDCR